MAGMQDKMKAEVQSHVPEPVIAIGLLQPAGTWGAMGGDQLSGIVGSLMRKNANKRSSGLGKNSAFKTKMAVVAVTEGRVYAFNAKGWAMQTKIADKVGDWAHDELEVTVTPGKMSTQFVIVVTETGDRFELETNALMGMGGFTQDFVKALQRGQAAPGDQVDPADPADQADPA